MNQHEMHYHRGHAGMQGSQQTYSHIGLATSATLHCLLGCGLGEVGGMTIGTALSFSNLKTMVLAIVLGFVLGFAFGLVPLLRAHFTFRQAAKQVLIAEGLSIAVMETAEVLVQVYTPGVMESHLSDPIYWIGMVLALIAGFAAAFPVNFILVKRGVRHQH
ncbi:MAG TPA: DUF4396 domain-containing protein [bacterium]